MKLSSETKLKDGRKLLAWWASLSRGRNMCTLAVVDGKDKRASKSWFQPSFYHRAETYSIGVNVHLSDSVLAKLRIKREDLIL